MAVVAVLNDVHGNLPALSAALEEAAAADVIVFGGDLAAGPFPVETLRLARSLGTRARFVSGNADRHMVEVFDGEAEPDEWGWPGSQIGREDRDFLAGFRPNVSIDGVLYCHATPSSDSDTFTEVSPEADVVALMTGAAEATVVCGHTHMQFDRHAGRWRVVNAGSVGMPYEAEPGAYWLWVADGEPGFRRTGYDLAAAARVISGSGWPQAAAFAAENVLETPGRERAVELFERQAEARRSRGR